MPGSQRQRFSFFVALLPGKVLEEPEELEELEEREEPEGPKVGPTQLEELKEPEGPKDSAQELKVPEVSNTTAQASQRQVDAHTPLAAARRFVHGLRTQAVLQVRCRAASSQPAAPSQCARKVVFPPSTSRAAKSKYLAKAAELAALQAHSPVQRASHGRVMVVRTHNGRTTPFYYRFAFRQVQRPTPFQVANNITWRMNVKRLSRKAV